LNDKEITKYEIAKKLELSHQSVYDWFSGKTLPNTENLIKLSKLLGKSMEDVLKDFKKESIKKKNRIQRGKR